MTFRRRSSFEHLAKVLKPSTPPLSMGRLRGVHIFRKKNLLSPLLGKEEDVTFALVVGITV